MLVLNLIIDVLVLILIFIWFLGLLCCTAYARFEKKRSVLNSIETNVNKQNSVADKVVEENMKSRVKRKAAEYLYGLCRYYSVLIGKIPSHGVRRFLMKNILCMDITEKTVLYGGFEIRSPWNIRIGDSVVGVGALLDGRRGIIIHDRVCLAQNVKLFTLQHDVSAKDFSAHGGGY